MCKLIYECIDDISTDIIMHDAFEYVTIPHVLKDNKCLDVYICCSGNYNDIFADNISIDRLKTRIPLLLVALDKYSLLSLFITSIALFNAFILFLSG